MAVVDDRTEDSLAPSAPAPAPKKPKSRSRLKSYLFFVLLAAGAVTGLHHSGFIDARPLIWNVVPLVPYVGDYLKDYLNIPEVYTLTVDERRKLELQQWQDRLDIKERELEERAARSESLSNEIAARQQMIDRQTADLARERDLTVRNEATPEEEELIRELTRTYQEISPRRSAQIMEQLPDHLAVELMRNLPQDTRASILSRMDPRRAARLTENLANPQ